MGRRKLREQRFGEEVLDVRRLARDRGKIERRVVFEHRGDQQQCDRPSVRVLVDPRAGVGVEAPAEAGAQESDRLLDAQSQIVDADLDVFVAGGEFAVRQPERLTRADHQLHVRRQIVQKVREQGLRRALGQQVRIVEKGYRGPRRFDDPGQQRRHRDRLALRALHCLQRRRAELRIAHRIAKAGDQSVHESRAVVALVKGEPAGERTLREHLAPPLREQRRLAVTGRRTDDDHAAIAHAIEQSCEPRPRQRRRADAGRCDLE